MRRLAFWMAAPICILSSGAAWADGDRQRGRELAIENCAQCHVIGDHNPYGGVNNSPSFYVFAERPEVYEERLRTFDQRRPHLSRDMRVSPNDIADIMAYVVTLERP
jgi:mono/diheme cytochrome c family protein